MLVAANHFHLCLTFAEKSRAYPVGFSGKLQPCSQIFDTYTEGVNPKNALAYYIIGLTVAVKWSAVDAPLNHLIINLGQIKFSSWFCGS